MKKTMIFYDEIGIFACKRYSFAIQKRLFRTPKQALSDRKRVHLAKPTSRNGDFIRF